MASGPEEAGGSPVPEHCLEALALEPEQGVEGRLARMAVSTERVPHPSQGGRLKIAAREELGALHSCFLPELPCDSGMTSDNLSITLLRLTERRVMSTASIWVG